MRGSFVSAYTSAFLIIAVLGCENEILLTPSSIKSDDFSTTTPGSNLYDTNPESYWYGAYYDEYVFYYFSAPIYVTEIYVQNWGFELEWLRAYIGRVGGGEYLGFHRNVESLEAVSFKVANTYVASSKNIYFWIRTKLSTDLPRISTAWVYGCYVTSTPTSFPTTLGPSNFPSWHPTTSPTMPPVTRLPSKAPTLILTISPTMTPTTSEPIHSIFISKCVTDLLTNTPLYRNSIFHANTLADYDSNYSRTNILSISISKFITHCLTNNPLSRTKYITYFFTNPTNFS